MQIGDKIGLFTIIKGPYKTGKYYKIQFECECGNVKETTVQNLEKQKFCSRSCLLMKKNKPGDKKHKLTFVESLNKQYVRVRCDCGNVTDILRSHWYRNKSCGCLKNLKGEENPVFKGIGDLYGKHWHSIISGATTRKLECSITKEYAWDLYLKQDKKCALTGLPIEMARDRWTASLDRVNSKVGYVAGNVQWVHKTVNKMKMNLNQEEFLSYCNLIVQHMRG